MVSAYSNLSPFDAAIQLPGDDTVKNIHSGVDSYLTTSVYILSDDYLVYVALRTVSL